MRKIFFASGALFAKEKYRLEPVQNLARPRQKTLICEHRSAAYIEVCEQRSTTNQGFMAGIVEIWSRLLISWIAICCFILCGCASSNVSRDVSSNIDQGVENTTEKVDYTVGSSIADSYQNTSQEAKGAIIGGAAGGVAGAFSSVGVFPGLLVGSIFGASYGAYIDSNATIEDQLQNRGATIVVLGDHILIVLPSARIFKAMTPRIKPDAYSTLYLVTRYINSYTKMLVKISAYTNDIQSKDVALALSQEQAESVSKFLAASGIDARLLYAVGYGGTSLVQRNSCDWADNDNYRIEITLEKEYV